MKELAEAAADIARRAGALLMHKLAAARSIDFKDDNPNNLVTDADRASEALILGELERRFPDHSVLAEEGGARGRSQGDYLWFVDPLDGTTNYAHGLPHFCVTLAVEGEDASGERSLLAGVVFDPVRDECFWASKGNGAHLNGRPLAVTRTQTLGAALLATGFPYDLHEEPRLPLGLFDVLALRVQGMRRMGSAALDLAYVAAGRFDGFFEFGLKPWDTAAGALLVQEAGGAVRRIDGAVYDVWCGDVLGAGRDLETTLCEVCGNFVRAHGWVPRCFGPDAQ